MTRSCDTETDRRNRYRFLGWTIVWVAAFLAASWTLRSDAELAVPVRWAIAIGPIVLGVPALLAYLRFLRTADELVRKIQLDGLAFGFCAGVFFGIGYRLLERVGAPEIDSAMTVAVMSIAWALGQYLASRRYR